jgi:hypothetical protein
MLRAFLPFIVMMLFSAGAALAQVQDRGADRSCRRALERRYPSVSHADTLVGEGGVPVSAHGPSRDFIADSEIVEVERLRPSTLISILSYTADNRAVIQQQSIRGCTAAVTAMLISDNDRFFDSHTLSARNLSDNATMIKDLVNARLEPVVTTVGPTTQPLAPLFEALQRHGSAILSVGGEIGGHVIVLDSLDFINGTARIREPHHGWAITITLKALTRRMFADVGASSYTIIQVQGGTGLHSRPVSMRR